MREHYTADYIEEIRSQDAFKNLRENQFSQWPNREMVEQQNRVEPICQPQFSVPFTLTPGASVFTIGSCFARNVEKSLVRLGFDIPTQRALGPGVSSAVLNNYTAPSMLNEVMWALNADTPFDPEKYFYKLGENKFVDLHLGGRWSRPTDFDTACDRRKRLHQANKELASSSLLILTLGLAEAWFDTELGIYLNSPPLKRLIDSYPDRFTLRVLRHAQIAESLEQVIATATKANQKKDLKVVITVSPVPLSSTFRPNTDVIVANTYSKSTLRSAAEEVAMGFDNVSYFPSYESITLSDRQETWENDMVHVRQKLIDINVSRMVARYVSQDEETVADPDILTQLAQNSFDKKAFDASLDLADRALTVSPDHERALFAKAQALFALRRRQDTKDLIYSKYEIAIGQDETDAKISMPFDVRFLLARLLRNEKSWDEATAVVNSCIEVSPKHIPSRFLLGDIAMETGDFDKAEEAFQSCFEISKRIGSPYFRLAQLEQRRGNLSKAQNLAEIALTIHPDNKRFKEFLTGLQTAEIVEE